MAEGQLRAGVAEVEITGGIGLELAGDLGTAKSTGVETPLMAKAAVLSDGGRSLALIALDLWGLEYETSERVKQTVSQQTDLAPESIMLVSSHTRGAPCTAPAVGCSGVAQGYRDEIIPKIARVAAEARSRLQEASIGAGQAQLPHLVHNHRLLTRNMKAITAWLGVPKNEVLGPEGPVDSSFDVIVVREGRGDPLCLFWSFAADNRFGSGDRVSAGLPHRVQEEISARLARHVPCLYLPGCGGNVSFNHGLQQTADAIASAIMAVQLETPCDPVALLDCLQERMILPIRDYSQHWSKPDIELKRPEAAEALAREVELLQQEGAHAVPTAIQVFRLGSLAIVGLPGIPFVEFALEIKRASPFRATTVLGNANHGPGYVIPRRSFENEGFESWPSRCSRIGPGGGEFMAEEAAVLLRELHRSRRL